MCLPKTCLCYSYASSVGCVARTARRGTRSFFGNEASEHDRCCHVVEAVPRRGMHGVRTHARTRICSAICWPWLYHHRNADAKPLDKSQAPRICPNCVGVQSASVCMRQQPAAHRPLAAGVPACSRAKKRPPPSWPPVPLPPIHLSQLHRHRYRRPSLPPPAILSATAVAVAGAVSAEVVGSVNPR